MKQGTHYKSSKKQSKTNFFAREESHQESCEKSRRDLKDLLGI